MLRPELLRLKDEPLGVVLCLAQGSELYRLSHALATPSFAQKKSHMTKPGARFRPRHMVRSAICVGQSQTASVTMKTTPEPRGSSRAATPYTALPRENITQTYANAHPVQQLHPGVAKLWQLAQQRNVRPTRKGMILNLRPKLDIVVIRCHQREKVPHMRHGIRDPMLHDGVDLRFTV